MARGARRRPNAAQFAIRSPQWHRVKITIGMPRHSRSISSGTAVDKTIGKPLDQSDRAIRRPQQQGPRIRGHPAAVKPCHHRAPFDGCKSQQIRATLWA
jgi:hypothetical protein